MEKTFTFKTEIEIDSSRIKELISTGVTGGCVDWLSFDVEDLRAARKHFKMPNATVTELVMAGATIACRDIETDNEVVGYLSLQNVVNALQAMANGKDMRHQENAHLKWHWETFRDEDDDAETADVVIQIATMGEIVYG